MKILNSTEILNKLGNILLAVGVILIIIGSVIIGIGITGGLAIP